MYREGTRGYEPLDGPKLGQSAVGLPRTCGLLVEVWPCRSLEYAGIDCVPIPTEDELIWLGCGVDEIKRTFVLAYVELASEVT
jgi:hypothetical protein